MASIRKAKKMGTYVPKKMTATQRELYNENLKLASQVNRRLKGLKNAGYRGTWASKKLINRLDNDVLKGWTKSEGGKVKIQKNLTETQMRSVQKSMKQFLKSKTSKVSGIKKTRAATIDSIRSTLSEDQKNRVSQEDAEFYYDMLGDNDFDFFADKIGASTLWSLIDDAIEQNDSESGWLNRLDLYIELNDLDVKEKARRIYDKYVN